MTRIFLLFLICQNAYSQKTTGNLPVTGNYDNRVNLSFDSVSNEISGFISAKQFADDGKTISFSCTVLFKGKFNNTNKFPIRFYEANNPNSIADGYLISNSKYIDLKSLSSVTYCQNFLDLKGDKGERFSFSVKRSYIYCSAIRLEKSIIYSNANDSSKTKAYLIKDDLVSVLRIKNDWVYIEYTGKKTINAWIKRDDLFKF